MAHIFSNFSIITLKKNFIIFWYLFFSLVFLPVLLPSSTFTINGSRHLPFTSSATDFSPCLLLFPLSPFLPTFSRKKNDETVLRSKMEKEKKKNKNKKKNQKHFFIIFHFYLSFLPYVPSPSMENSDHQWQRQQTHTHAHAYAHTV